VDAAAQADAVYYFVEGGIRAKLYEYAENHHALTPRSSACGPFALDPSPLLPVECSVLAECPAFAAGAASWGCSPHWRLPWRFLRKNGEFGQRCIQSSEYRPCPCILRRELGWKHVHRQKNKCAHTWSTQEGLSKPTTSVKSGVNSRIDGLGRFLHSNNS
jgi:hypothetical protein